METYDWLVTENGECLGCETPEDEFPDRPYRLYRFLTEIEDILDTIEDERSRLEKIRPLVRRLLTSSYWLQGEYKQPDPTKGWSVLMLYDEPDFALTVQTVAWLPGKVSPIHNHATWGVVAVVNGQEKNKFWRKTGNPEFPDEITEAGEKIFLPGEIITFCSDAIHSVETLGDEPAITFNLYGKTDFNRRFEFDPVNRTAKKF